MLLPKGQPMAACPTCRRPSSGLVLFPMSFREIDEAKRTSVALPNAPKGRGRKRKSGSEASAIDEKVGAYVSERRTGRWTQEETALCEKLINKFQTGELPVTGGMKLNEFLGNMLKSKQSRLTKKMKNAKLSSKTYNAAAGGILDDIEAREFSEIEDCFFQAIQCHQERAEIKFHMQREWREQFSQYCAAISQPLDADNWLSSVEEMDRRASQAKDAARMAKRKLMMGIALRTDCRNPDNGVFIERTASESRVAENAALDGPDTDHTEMLQMLTEESKHGTHADINGKSSLLHSAPFLAKAILYLQRHGVPFEHIDLWVPSFVPAPGDVNTTNCRLCYAGNATVEEQIGRDGKTKSKMSTEDEFNLFAFGDYSEKFSFDVGCGLPGRVYESGRPTWEQSVHNAPHHHFDRCGGAMQWGIRTVLGIPIASPNVGRIVVSLYSRHDRPKDEELVARLSEEFTRLMPSPKWKLVVDLGESEAAKPAATRSETLTDNGARSGNSTEVSDNGSYAEKSPPTASRDSRIDDVVSLLGELMPSDPNSPLATYLSGFMSLRLLLLRPNRNQEEEELARTMLDSYTSYSQGGRSRDDIGVMLARDFMFLSQQKTQQQQHQQPAAFFSLGQSAVPSQASALSEYSNAFFGPSTFPTDGTADAGINMKSNGNTASANVNGNANANEIQISPTLGPIAGFLVDTMSIVSNS